MESTFSWLLAGPFMYLAVIIMVVAVAKKVYTFMTMPRHLRWDLYPIAHDGPEGSPYQEMDHWEKHRKPSLAHEIAEMGEEIIFLKRTFQHNRKMWNFSYPMHAGMYFVIAWMALIVFGAILQICAGVKIASTSTIFWAQAINAVTVVVGVLGLVAGLFGTLGILYLRYTDEDLKDYTSPVTFLNLYLLLALFGVGLFAWFTVDSSFAVARNYVQALLTFKSIPLPGIMVLEIVLLAIFFIYLPFSRMLHFVGKYFFYHDIMWDDEMLVKGGKLENNILGYMGYNMNWSAPHINPNDTWINQAGTNPTKEAKKKE